MALKAVEGDLVFGPKGLGAGSAGLTGVISTTTERKYSSEVEVVGGDGEIVDIVYSGAEETVTETQYSSTWNKTDVGSGTYDDGITIRTSIQFSNEDMSKVEVEKIKKL